MGRLEDLQAKAHRLQDAIDKLEQETHEDGHQDVARKRLEDRRKELEETRAAIDKLKAHKAEQDEPDWNGHPPLSDPRLVDACIRGNKAGLVVTATTDGQHATNSLHYQARAIDFGGYVQADKDNFQASEFERQDQTELLGPINNKCRLAGHNITLTEGSELETAHDNHVHVAY